MSALPSTAIVVQNCQLESRWAAWFDGITLTHADAGSTVLTGSGGRPGRTARLLNKIRDVGLPLISVTQVQPDPPAVPPMDPR
jgi:hypothetical protein